MSGVIEFERNVRRDVHFPVIGKRYNLVCCFYNVIFIKKRTPGKFFAFFVRLFCKEFSISCLNARAVHHNKICNVARCRSCVNISGKSFFCKDRQKSAVVIVSVRKNDCIKFVGSNVEIPVLCIRKLALSLKSTTVYHYLMSVYFQNML